jgi:hypothetical protein
VSIGFFIMLSFMITDNVFSSILHLPVSFSQFSDCFYLLFIIISIYCNEVCPIVTLHSSVVTRAIL